MYVIPRIKQTLVFYTYLLQKYLHDIKYSEFKVSQHTDSEAFESLKVFCSDCLNSGQSSLASRSPGGN